MTKKLEEAGPSTEILNMAVKSGVRPSAELLMKAYREGVKKIRTPSTTAAPKAQPTTPAPTTAAPSAPAAPKAQPAAPKPSAQPAAPAATAKKVNPVAVGAGAAALGAGVVGTGYMVGKKTSDNASAKGTDAAPPVPQKPQRQTAPAAPKAAAPKERFIDTASIYKKHGVGSPDEDTGAFHRAEAEIKALKKANPTQIDPRSSTEYAGRLTQQRAEDEAAAKKAATPKAPAAPKQQATPAATKVEPPKAAAPSSIESPPSEKELATSPDALRTDVKSSFAQRTPEQGVGLPTDTFTKPEPKEKKKVEESRLVQAFLSLQSSKHANIFEAAKKLTKKQDEKLDVVDDDKIDEKDFAALRASKKKMEESKMADKDYDGDGKIESSKDEVWGSRLKAAKKAGKMEEAAEPALKKSTTTDPDFAAPSANPDAPESPIKYKEEPKAPPVPQRPQRSTVKEAYIAMLKNKNLEERASLITKVVKDVSSAVRGMSAGEKAAVGAGAALSASGSMSPSNPPSEEPVDKYKLPPVGGTDPNTIDKYKLPPVGGNR